MPGARPASTVHAIGGLWLESRVSSYGGPSSAFSEHWPERGEGQGHSKERSGLKFTQNFDSRGNLLRFSCVNVCEVLIPRVNKCEALLRVG